VNAREDNKISLGKLFYKLTDIGHRVTGRQLTTPAARHRQSTHCVKLHVPTDARPAR